MLNIINNILIRFTIYEGEAKVMNKERYIEKLKFYEKYKIVSILIKKEMNLIMKVGIISDIHGNIKALEAVLQELKIKI